MNPTGSGTNALTIPLSWSRPYGPPRHVAALTGAGISVESSIPTFRSQGGIWDRYQPVSFDDFMSSKEARIAYWRRQSELYPG